MEVLSKRQPTDAEMKDAHISWIATKAIQSNSFAFVKDAVLLAECGGQTNREDSAKFASERADEFEVSLKGSAAATDSFIFDRQAIDLLQKLGVTVVGLRLQGQWIVCIKKIISYHPLSRLMHLGFTMQA